MLKFKFHAMARSDVKVAHRGTRVELLSNAKLRELTEIHDLSVSRRTLIHTVTSQGITAIAKQLQKAVVLERESPPSVVTTPPPSSDISSVTAPISNLSQEPTTPTLQTRDMVRDPSPVASYPIEEANELDVVFLGQSIYEMSRIDLIRSITMVSYTMEHLSTCTDLVALQQDAIVEGGALLDPSESSLIFENEMVATMGIDQLRELLFNARDALQDALDEGFE